MCNTIKWQIFHTIDGLRFSFPNRIVNIFEFITIYITIFEPSFDDDSFFKPIQKNMRKRIYF